MSLSNIQGKLSRTEMKKIMAGSGSGSQGCCAHTPGWGQYQCGYSSSSEAESAASAAAQECDCQIFYCCDCSDSPGYLG